MSKAYGITVLTCIALIITCELSFKVPEWRAKSQLPDEMERISAEAAEICEKHGIKEFEISFGKYSYQKDQQNIYYIIVDSPERPPYKRIYDLLCELDELEFDLPYLQNDPYLLLSKGTFAGERYNINSGNLKRGLDEVYSPTTARRTTEKPTETVPKTTRKSSGYKSYTPKTTEEDPYYARDYLYPEDFYYDFYDDFDSYEDAEDYFDEMF